MTYTVASLFAGAVDGLGIAFQQAGFAVTYHNEIDAWCCQVLAANFPHSTIDRRDIRDIETIPYADVLVGSPPCQPWSTAANGRRSADDRHLWPDMLRLVGAVRPRCVVVENVAGGVSRGLVDEICMDLEREDYEPIPLVLPARAIGASHYRNRVFIVAYTKRNGQPRPAGARQPAHHPQRHPAAYQQSRVAKRGSHITGGKVLGRRRLRKPGMERDAHGPARRMDRPNPAQFPGHPALQGQPQKGFEPPRLVSHPGDADTRRIQALGNAIVWQQVLPVAQAVKTYLQVDEQEAV